jgi:hypothetical protein
LSTSLSQNLSTRNPLFARTAVRCASCSWRSLCCPPSTPTTIPASRQTKSATYPEIANCRRNFSPPRRRERSRSHNARSASVDAERSRREFFVPRLDSMRHSLEVQRRLSPLPRSAMAVIPLSRWRERVGVRVAFQIAATQFCRTAWQLHAPPSPAPGRSPSTSETGRKMLLHFRHFRHPWRSDGRERSRCARRPLPPAGEAKRHKRSLHVVEARRRLSPSPASGRGEQADAAAQATP